MRQIDTVLADMDEYLASLNEDENYYQTREKHFKKIDELYNQKNYNALIEHVNGGIKLFSIFSIDQNPYLGYLQELRDILAYKNVA